MDTLDSWQLAARSERKSPRTVSIVTESVRQLAALAGDDPLAVRPVHVRTWMVARREAGWSESTLSMAYRGARTFYVWAVAEGEITANPFDKVKPPRPSTQPARTAMTSDVEKVIKTIPVNRNRFNCRDRAMILCLWDSGLRRGEVLSMTVEGIDLVTRQVSVIGKAGPRTVPISARTASAIDKYLRVSGHCGALWRAHDHSKALGPTGLRLVLVRRSQAAGVQPLNPHAFRHGLAHRWLSEGGSETGLIQVMGWNSGAMLQVYGRNQKAQRAQSEHSRLIG